MRDKQFISASNESPRMFKNNFLDKLSRANPIIVPIVYVPVISYFLYLGFTYGVGILAAIGAMAAGIIFWTMFEYFLHRYVFHWDLDNAFGRGFHFFVHGVHHDYPNDELRLVMPPGASITLAILMYWIFYGVVVGLIGAGMGFFSVFYASFVFGYLVYDMMHYSTHYYNFKWKWFQTIKRSHLDHHYVDHDKGFGLSNVFWDKVFNTEQESVKRKNKK